MPRPDPRQPGIGQSELFDAAEPTARPFAGAVLRGRHSQAVDRALAAARDAEIIGAADEAAATLVRAGAWALDSMETSGHHYGPAKLIPGLTEALRELHMTPDSRGTDTEAALAELLEDLARVDAPADDDAPLPDAAS